MIVATALRPAGRRRRRGARPAHRREQRRHPCRARRRPARRGPAAPDRRGTPTESRLAGSTRAGRPGSLPHARTTPATAPARTAGSTDVTAATIRCRAGESDGFEHGGIAGTPLEVPRDRLGQRRPRRRRQRRQRAGATRRAATSAARSTDSMSTSWSDALPRAPTVVERSAVSAARSTPSATCSERIVPGCSARCQRPPASVGPARTTSWPPGSSTRSSLRRMMPTTTASPMLTASHSRHSSADSGTRSPTAMPSAVPRAR